MISPEQIRAARAILDWSTADLAQLSGLTVNGLNKIERGQVTPHKATLETIQRLFEGNGIEFLDLNGVRTRPTNIMTFEGVDGFTRFYDFIYETLRVTGGSVCIGGSDATLYSKYRADPEKHRGRMAELAKERTDLNVRILCKEGDYNFVATSYAKYRWQPKQYFSPNTFYTFGEHLALISFTHKPAPHVILIKSASHAEAYRHAFDIAWENAKEPTPKKGKE